MSASQVIRPENIGRWPTWVHLAGGDGTPLCGGEMPAEYRYESQDEVEQKAICKVCLQSEAQYTVEVLRYGQIRRYGPSHYIYRVTDLRKEKRARDEVLADCRCIVKVAYLKSEPNDHPDDSAWPYFRPTIKEFSEISAGVWRYFVSEASTH